MQVSGGCPKLSDHACREARAATQGFPELKEIFLVIAAYPLHFIVISFPPTSNKMSTTAMHFGPEWMRPKTQTSRSSTRESSPPPATSPAPPGASTYSALLTPSMPAPPERPDGANPFKYSRDELLRIYQEGGGKGSLGLEVERWEGVVREVSSDPIALKDFSEADKKVC